MTELIIEVRFCDKLKHRQNKHTHEFVIEYYQGEGKAQFRRGLQQMTEC